MSVAWITGGGTGIGRALAEALARDGWRVAITGRRPEVLEQAVAAMRREEVAAVPANASDAGQVARAHDAIRQRWGDVNLLVNNAGVNTFHSFHESTPEEFAESFRVNCLSAVVCTRAVLPAMLIARRGAIVNVSSILGRWASSASASYSVSKYALAGLTEALRLELVGTGVHVMGVYPGLIATAMTERALARNPRAAKFVRSPEAMARAILKGLNRRDRDVLYPWYVAVALHLHRWFPGTLERLQRVYSGH